MNIPCEIVVQKILPVIRANLAKELVQKHSLRQEQVAKELGLTQPAVSHYLKEFRGKGEFKIGDAKFHRLISEFADRMKAGKTTDPEKNAFVCDLCRHCRSTALICRFHYPKGAPECSACMQALGCD